MRRQGSPSSMGHVPRVLGPGPGPWAWPTPFALRHALPIVLNMASMESRRTSVNCPHGHPPAGAPGDPWAPLGPQGAPWGPQGAPRGPPGPLGAQIHCYGSRINSKPSQKIDFWAFLGPKWVKKKLGFRPRDPYGEIRAGILRILPPEMSKTVGWRPIWWQKGVTWGPLGFRAQLAHPWKNIQLI